MTYPNVAGTQWNGRTEMARRGTAGTVWVGEERKGRVPQAGHGSTWNEKTRLGVEWQEWLAMAG